MEPRKPVESDVIFPSVNEIKSYFPEDVWNTMAEYERNSYRNILHNYNVMNYLDLKPKKPSFMVMNQKKTCKRKAVMNPCTVPSKKPLLTEEKPPKIVASNSTSVTKNKKVSNIAKAKLEQKTRTGQKTRPEQKTGSEQKRSLEQKTSPMFSSSHQWRIIKMQCVFAAVFKVYKRFHGTIKGNYSQKTKQLKIPKNNPETTIENYEKVEEINIVKNFIPSGDDNKSDNNKKNSDDKDFRAPEKHCVKSSSEKEINEEGVFKKPTEVLTRHDNAPKNLVKEKSSMDVKKEGSETCQKPAIRQTKPVRRSVQTMTAAVGCSPSDSALVFVSAASSKKLPSNPFPDPASLSPEEKKRMKRISRQKMKNCRNVQTQTAADDSSIEKSKLVFFPVSKSKKSKSQHAATQSVDAKNASVATRNTPEATPSTQEARAYCKDTDDVAVRSSLDQPEDDETVNKPKGVDVQNLNDDSSEDVFGFYDLFKEEIDAKNASEATSNTPEATSNTPEATSNTPEATSNTSEAITHHKDTDVTVHSSSDPSERRYPRRAVPVIDYKETELLQDDEYLFCDLCDREYEGDCPEHGPHKFYPDRFVPVTGDGSRAVLTTPDMLKVDKSKIPGAGSGVWTKSGLSPHVRFGPYQGDEAADPDPLGYSWAVVKDKKVDHYIAAQSTATSNWMRFVNCARHETEQNLMAFQYKGLMYYRTVKPIPPKSELFVWYGKEYAELLGISMQSFRGKDTSHLRSLVFACDRCGITYSSPLYLEVHSKWCRGKRTAMAVEPSSVPVDVQSLAVVVDGKKTYCCNVCEYKTGFCGDMKRHVMSHMGQRPYVCDVCGKGFTQDSSLVSHKRVHTGEKPYKCPQCSYACKHRSSLNKHMRTHTEEKPYSCAVCPYRAVHSGDLTRHMRKHTGEKPFTCPHCSYRTGDSGALTRHMRIHTDENPFTCPQCSYRTGDSGNLTRHMRIHTGEKPFTCPHCSYRAARKHSLNTHIAKHH